MSSSTFRHTIFSQKILTAEKIEAMQDETALSKKLRDLADLHPARSDELHRLANDFDQKTADMMSADKPRAVPMMLGAWARARRVYCELTGKPLV